MLLHKSIFTESFKCKYFIELLPVVCRNQIIIRQSFLWVQILCQTDFHQAWHVCQKSHNSSHLLVNKGATESGMAIKGVLASWAYNESLHNSIPFTKCNNAPFHHIFKLKLSKDVHILSAYSQIALYFSFLSTDNHNYRKCMYLLLKS